MKRETDWQALRRTVQLLRSLARAQVNMLRGTTHSPLFFKGNADAYGLVLDVMRSIAAQKKARAQK